MKKTLINIFATSLVVGLSLTNIAFAADEATATLPIAVVDGNKVFQQFQPAIEEDLKKEFKDQQQKLMTMQDDLQKMSGQLDKDAEIMSEAEVEKLQEKFAEKQMEFQQISVEYSEAYNERGNEEFQKLIERVQTAAAALAKEKNYALVVQKGAVLYSDDKYDVTDDLIKQVEATK
jgi:outer membrane protein